VKNKLVRDVMTKKVLTVEADWSIAELKDFLIEHGISGAPVTDANGLVGVVSSTDLLRADVAPQKEEHDFFAASLDRALSPSELGTMHIEGSSDQTVRDVMTPVVFQVAEDTRVDEVADMMARGQIHRVLVTSGRRVTGIVSALDLVGELRDVLRSE